MSAEYLGLTMSVVAELACSIQVKGMTLSSTAEVHAASHASRPDGMHLENEDLLLKQNVR